MRDIEHSLRRYADALERAATARVDAPPHRRRGALVACVAALAVVAVASTAIVITRDDQGSRVSTVGSSVKPGPSRFPVRCPQANQLREFEVFMNPSATAAQVAAVRTTLRSDANVRSFYYLSHADAYREFSRLFRRQPGLVSSTQASDLPESFRVKARNARSVQLAKLRLEPLGGVEAVNIDSGCRLAKIPTPPDPTVWVTATVELDTTTFLQGEDVTGEITFTNHLPTDALITDPNGCLGKWGVGIAPGHVRIEVFQTMECRPGPTLPEPAGAYLAFRPGVTRVPLRVSGTFQSCTGSSVATPEMQRCLADNTLPKLPIGPARIRLVIAGPGGHVHAPGPIPIRIVERGDRPPFCTTAQLDIHESSVRLAQESGRAIFIATNISRHTCTLDGVPLLRLPGGAIVPDRYVDITSAVDDAAATRQRRTRPVVLHPRETASFAVAYRTTNADGAVTPDCRRKIPVLSVTLPDQAGNVDVDVPTTMEPCPGTPVGANPGAVQVTVSTFVAGSGGARR